MFLRNWLKLLHFMGLEFWLPLPILGVAFWLGGNQLTEKVLSRPYTTVNKLQADVQPEFYLSMHVLFIQAEVDRNAGVTKVFVQPINASLNKSKFQVATTDISQIEIAIAKRLEMSIDDIRKLVRYQIIE
ncbi:hypothetical protein FNW02_16260 [Komarekiella sp. 'clone 1']|uniref:Uncharacterized protein n=1 Tax=Komarekiella delphini-convector SJRDD-AB1 TaxID=2593771 RepID=A0AA40VRM7_9NOST|nr:hypothetical protein [Komarekiella delphini-convector]MBD6617337.1 hypothetical protein [Komarekiella delphini-convector SJRDD-AB1]